MKLQRLGCIVFCLLGAVSFLASCDESSSNSEGEPPSQPMRWNAAQVIEHLPGHWVRVDEQEPSVIQKSLVFSQAGEFSETTLLSLSNGETQSHRHSGTWLFDGVNLKRKYNFVDGRAPSRMNLPFVTFEIHFISRNEFQGIDHIHNNQIHYVRESDSQDLD